MKKTETQETEISETETSEVTDLPEEEELFYPWIIGNAEFMVPAGVIPSNMVGGR